MNPQRYAQLNDLFAQVCDLSPTARSDSVARLCGDDQSLRADLMRLLAAHDEAGSDHDTASALADPDIDLPSEIAGYTITGLLGVGGMGVVYRARQRQPAREVALKVLHAGLQSANLRRRFQREAEVLGRLQHPGIAQVYEAGEWLGDGRRRPFFAMELVEGLPLTEFAQRHALDTRRRLELLATICDAVEHAHQRGVIHRDLKPGNILVEECGRPRILDFGVARAIDSDIRVTTQRTDVGQLIGTVTYMSPEQAMGDPAEIDHRSDIYALGVILYELLAGEPPLSLHARSLPDAVRAIRDDDPAPLSTIDRTFRGDLETIVSKAMEKDAARRYQSAAELAADLRRYMGDEPIAARPATTLYQLGKFSRRHKGLVAGLAAAMLMLVVATGFSTWMAWREHQAGEAASKQADRAERVKNLMIGMFAPVYPNRPASKVTVQDMLAQATERVRSELGDQPDIAGEMRYVLATIYHNLDLSRHAVPLLKELLAEQKASGTDPATWLPTLNLLADAYNRDCDYTEASACEREMLEIHRRRGPAASVEVIAALSGLAHTLTFGGDPEHALRLRYEALTLLDSIEEPRPVQRYGTNLGIGTALMMQGRFADAEVQFRGIVRDPEFGKIFWPQYYLALVLVRQSKTDDAMTFLMPLLEMARKQGEGEPRRLGLALNLYSLALEARKELGPAEDAARQAIAIFENIDAAKLPAALRQLASVLHKQGKYEQALDTLNKAHEVMRPAWRGSADEAATLALKAQVLTDMGNATAAAEAAESARRIARSLKSLDADTFHLAQP